MTLNRKPHELTANHKNEIPRYRIYLDSESRVDPNTLVHSPWLLCATFKDSRYKKATKKVYLHSDIENFWKDAAAFGGKHNCKVYLYAHNLGYDLIATGGIPALIKEGFFVESYFEKGTTFLINFNKETGEGDKKRTKTICGVSSTNYYSMSLKKIGEAFGLDKIEYEYNEGTEIDGITYCQRDVEILEMAMETFIDFIQREDLGCLGKTTPGQAFNTYRHRFMPETIFIHDNEFATELERQAYYGGRTECWWIGRKAGEFFGYDVNSMYPAVMLKNLFPTKIKTFRKRCTIPELKDYLSRDYLICAECKVKVDKPYFPLKVNDALIFPIGEFWTTLSTPEIIFALERGLLVDVGKVSLYEGANIFEDYVNYFYSKRQIAKAEANKVLDLLYKLFMNSLYGKFGQRSEKWERQGPAAPEEISVIDVIDAQTDEKRTYKTFGGSVFLKQGEEEGFNSFCAVAAHVTAYARMNLLRFIEIAGWENVLYMDTDSLFVNKTGNENLLPHHSETELGLMKLEKQDERIEIYSPKDYKFAGEEKKKGVKKNEKGKYVMVTDPKELRNLARKHKLSYSYIKDKTYDTVSFPKINTFLREGNLSYFHNVRRKKVLMRQYTKGFVLDNGQVLPFEVKHIANDSYIIPWEYTSYAGKGLTLRDELQIRTIKKKYRKMYGNNLSKAGIL